VSHKSRSFDLSQWRWWLSSSSDSRSYSSTSSDDSSQRNKLTTRRRNAEVRNINDANEERHRNSKSGCTECSTTTAYNSVRPSRMTQLCELEEPPSSTSSAVFEHWEMHQPTVAILEDYPKLHIMPCPGNQWSHRHLFIRSHLDVDIRYLLKSV
jgi:hypothetical protein